MGHLATKYILGSWVLFQAVNFFMAEQRFKNAHTCFLSMIFYLFAGEITLRKIRRWNISHKSVT